MMRFNKLAGIHRCVGAIIHYALAAPVRCEKGVMNYGPYIPNYIVNSHHCAEDAIHLVPTVVARPS